MILKSNLQVGQVLWLKVRYQIDVVSDVIHPMLIAKIEKDYIEVIAIDKTFGKMQCLYHEYNFFINSKNPTEDVIYEETKKLLLDKKAYEKMSKASNPYGDGHASERIVDAIIEYFNK